MPSSVGVGHDVEQRPGHVFGALVVTVVDEEHVDVAGVVELTPAELSHPDHRERERRIRTLAVLGAAMRARPPGTPARARPAPAPRPGGRRRRAGRGRRCAGARVASTDGVRVRRRVRPSRHEARYPSTVRSRCEGVGVAQRVEQGRVGDDRGRQRSRRTRQGDQAVARATRRARAPRRPPARASIDASHHRARRRRVGRTVDGCDECRIVEHRFAASHPGSVAYPEGMPRLRIAAAQLNVVVGDLDGNAARIIDAYEKAEAAGCDLVAFPELALTGYPPEDLLLRQSFVARSAEVLDKLAARTGRMAAVVGFPDAVRDLYNAAAVLRERARARRLPQAPVAQLRGVRRAALLRAVHRRRPALRGGRGSGRGGDLRRRVEPERPDLHPSGRRRRARREHQRVALLRRPDPGTGGDARDTRRRRVGAPALREPRRRPGRARLRRRVDAVRRGWAPRCPRPSNSRKTCSSSTSTSAPPSDAVCSIHAGACAPSRSPR